MDRLVVIMFPFWWAFNIVVKLAVLVAGLFMVPVVYKYRYVDIQDVPKWLLLFCNPEDHQGGDRQYKGSLPTWWISREGDGFWPFYKYHAIRNPADGLRNFEFFNCKVRPERVKYWTPRYLERYEPWYVGTPGWYGYIAWQDYWVGWKILWVREKTYSEIKFGFKIVPRDSTGIDPNSSRGKHGASFASKFLINREWSK